jgi:malonate transporter MadL subunit
MAIYGVALLSACMILGVFFGNVLGMILNVKANIGGVGFAMVMLILASSYGIKKGWLTKPSQDGIAFWSAMYIPIVVAMSAKQNVVAALTGGPVAILAGGVAVILGFAFIPLLTKIATKSDANAVSK